MFKHAMEVISNIFPHFGDLLFVHLCTSSINKLTSLCRTEERNACI